MDKMNVNLVHMDGIERQPKFKNHPHPSPIKFFWLASSYRAILSSNLLLTKCTSKCARSLTGCSNYTLINLPNPITRLIFNSLKITKNKNPDHQIQQFHWFVAFFFFSFIPTHNPIQHPMHIFISKLNVIWNLGAFLVLLKSPWWARFNRVYFTIFRAKVWKILIFEWILLLKIQTNCKNWVGKENSVELSMCSYLGQRPCYTSHALYNGWERYEKKNWKGGRESHRGCSPHNNPSTHKMI